jgi:hypothetical protein
MSRRAFKAVQVLDLGIIVLKALAVIIIFHDRRKVRQAHRRLASDLAADTRLRTPQPKERPHVS